MWFLMTRKVINALYIIHFKSFLIYLVDYLIKSLSGGLFQIEIIIKWLKWILIFGRLN